MTGAFPKLRFDDISSASADDGLGYIYLADGGYSPTIAHTGDTELSAEQNRAFGHLFAAAPELYEAAESVIALADVGIVAQDHPRVLQARAALARARGEQP